MDRKYLALKWEEVSERFSLDSGFIDFSLIERKYKSRLVHYHTLDHIEMCNRELDSVEEHLEDPWFVRLILFFHDMGYNPKSDANELYAADFSETIFRYHGKPREFIDKARGYILSTGHSHVSFKPDMKYLLDIDLCIFGKDKAIFDAYDDAIRREFKFLSRKSIYHTEEFGEKYEFKALENLLRAKEKWFHPT